MSNYDPKMTEEIVSFYISSSNKRKAIEELAKYHNRSEKSIIGKLAREGVYEKSRYLNKRGELPETKKEIIARLAGLLNLNPERIQGLEKAPKLELQLIERALFASVISEKQPPPTR
jgi:hypothetical protein